LLNFHLTGLPLGDFKFIRWTSGGACAGEEKMSEDTGSMTEAAVRLRKDLKRELAAPIRLEKALEALVRIGGEADLGVVSRAATTIAAVDLPRLGLESHTGLAGSLEGRRQRMRERARGTLLAALRDQASAAGLDMTIAGERPLTVELAPFSVELDLEKGKAVVLYAREPIADCGLDASEILACRDSAMTTVRSAACESTVFFGHLRAAYGLALAARQLGDGARIDLVDLRAPLALLSFEARSWRGGQLDKIAPYPRYLLAYQLSRLRRDGLLAHQGIRAELGTATGGSTRNKADVLFVPTSTSEGQYYLSLRLVAGGAL
jgi:hypothetical protein